MWLLCILMATSIADVKRSATHSVITPLPKCPLKMRVFLFFKHSTVVNPNRTRRWDIKQTYIQQKYGFANNQLKKLMFHCVCCLHLPLKCPRVPKRRHDGRVKSITLLKLPIHANKETDWLSHSFCMTQASNMSGYSTCISKPTVAVEVLCKQASGLQITCVFDLLKYLLLNQTLSNYHS